MEAGVWLRNRRNDEFAIVECVDKVWVNLRLADRLSTARLRPEEVRRDWYRFRGLKAFQNEPIPSWAQPGSILADIEEAGWYRVEEVRYGSWARLEMLYLPEGRRYFLITTKGGIESSFRPVSTRYERV
jgi:hypothetical protein